MLQDLPERNTSKPPTFKSNKLRHNKILKNRIMQRVAELRLCWNIPWPTVAANINHEFATDLQGQQIPETTLYSRFQVYLKKHDSLSKKEKHKILLKIRQINDYIQQIQLVPALQGDPEAAKLLLKANDQLAKIYGLFADGNSNKIEINNINQQATTISSIEKSKIDSVREEFNTQCTALLNNIVS